MLLPMIAEPVVPPGFRFRPTDVELVEYYLKKKVESSQEDLDVIREIDLYKLEPWDLQEACKIGFTEQDDWYFFSHKDKKYPTGTRMNRATTAGFWKATGRDKAIYAKSKLVGMRKTLVFYKGRAPNGQKTDWIMHEYRLESYENGCMQANEEGWVVCRVFKKRCTSIKKSHELDYFYDDFPACNPEIGSAKNDPHIVELPYNHSFTCMQELALEYQLLNDPFTKLPQLESPKVSSYVSTSNIKAFAGENYERLDYQSPTFDARKTNFEWPLTETTAMSAFPMNADASEEQQLADWRVLDKLVSSQLSQDDVLKGIKLPSKANDHLGDLALCIHYSKQQNNDCPTSNSVHLWDLV